MLQSVHHLNNSEHARAIVERFGGKLPSRATSYATVRDYCESRDELPQITPVDGDLKNVQRPWAAKTILGTIPPPARLLEIGGGEPIVSGFLAELGYDVTLVDPYDGFGNGPTEYEVYVERFPNVKIVREYFGPDSRAFTPGSFDAIFSISVLEHLPPDPLGLCFEAIRKFLNPAGFSIHCFDFILQGRGEVYDYQHAERILAEQAGLGDSPADLPFEQLLRELRADTETFFLSPQGHHHWRGGRAYAEFPFRKVVSLQTITRRGPGNSAGPNQDGPP